ncbi:MAG TPA: class I SAM-dependent rRNA methyltransferase [Prolixibacteraceae bacterium]|nr:class I SAM-dependent rRNA methyltransferase [Prolixibacteraceae bacterium]
MKEYKTIVLKPGKEQSLLRFHPWVFSGAVKHLPSGLKEGEVVRVVSGDGQLLGIGHYQIGSIVVRVFSFREESADQHFWEEKLSNAWQLRLKAGLLSPGTNTVFRWVHGEGDGLPGLIVDYYDGVAVMQCHSAGMFLIREQLAEALRSVAGELVIAVYDKSEKTVPFKAGLSPCDGYLLGKASVPRGVMEGGNHFLVDWESGQKTGFFVDQRENRRLVGQYAAGRKVLNLFCYTGGFSVYALQGGAVSVHSVDASAPAIRLTDENVRINFPEESRHQSYETDAFDFLRDISSDYDLMILDPPAFAKHLEALPQALKAYKRINARAFQQIAPGGILFTFSCSQIVSREKFREAVFSAAAISKRNVRILHQLTQPADHPISIYHPEGEYLKGLVLWVE